ncbi:MAG: 4-hydroxy-tetrahydrodipicolinate reductase, partial [Myxococcota bacterium]
MSTGILVVGAMGRMGERVRAALADHPTLSLGAAVERPGHPDLGRELAAGILLGDDGAAALGSVDAAIIFATPDATLELLRRAADAGVPCAVGTTGFSSD